MQRVRKDSAAMKLTITNGIHSPPYSSWNSLFRVIFFQKEGRKEEREGDKDREGGREGKENRVSNLSWKEELIFRCIKS